MALTDQFFNAKYYLEQNADVAAAWGGTAWEHYLAWGATEGRAPNAWFDAQYYRANNADLASMNAIELFQHYTNHGYAEARVPDSKYANFDAAAYLADYADLAAGGITAATALNHYLTFGIDESRAARNTDGTEIIPTTEVVEEAVPGSTFTLTVGADTFAPNAGNSSFKTTAGDDVFRAITGLSLETVDAIDGGEGNDTLNVAAGALVVAGARPVLKSVETINIVSNLATDTLNLGDSTGVEAINVTSTAAASVVTVNSIPTLDTTIGTGTSTAAGVIDVDFTASTAGSSDTLNVALGNNNAFAMTIQSTVDTGTFEAISIAANGSKSGTSVAGNNAPDVVVFNNADFNTVKTITVTGDGNSNITSASAALTTVDATEANGNNIYVFAGAAGKTISTGSGNDTVTGGAGNDTFNTGAGNDTITGALGNDVFNGGLGADTYNDAGGTDTFVIETSTIEDLGFDTIASGFATTVDSIKFVGGEAATAATYAEATTAGTGFVSARSAALTQLAGDADLKYVAVADNGGAGNLFVFFDGDGDNLLSTNGSDFAVQLTGLNTTNIALGDIVAGA